ncbi:hypothetical protein JW964_05760 [candidate division KSB1 bacterium]|nr:hypothetical protein [candidate division KSB1 bacterium]
MKSRTIFIFTLVLILFLHCIKGNRDEKTATKIEAEVFFKPRDSIPHALELHRSLRKTAAGWKIVHTHWSFINGVRKGGGI